MRVLEPGHKYLLEHLESKVRAYEVLTFVKRSSGAISYGPDEHPGTNTQEALRVCINRTEYLYGILPAVETKDAAWYMRMALFCYEARAWRRKQQGLNKGTQINDYVERYEDVPFNEQDIEILPVGPDGHIIVPTAREVGVFGR